MPAPPVLERYPRLTLFAGAFCIAFAAIFVKFIDLGPGLSAALRCTLAGAVLVPLMVRDRRRLAVLTKPGGGWLFVLLAGLTFAIDLFIWHRSIVIVGAGMATILGNTQALYLAVIGLAFFREKLSWQLVVALPLAFMGIFILIDPLAVHTEQNYWWGILLGLLTGPAYACYILCLRQVQMRLGAVSSFTTLGMVSLASGFFLSLFCLMSGEWEMPSLSDWLWLLVLALVVQIAGWALIARSLPLVPVSASGLIILTQPVGATLMGMIIFAEVLTHVQLIGAALTLLAIYLGVIRKTHA